MNRRHSTGCLLLSLAFLAACSSADKRPSGWQLTDGTPLGALSDGAAVVLVMDPSDYPACQSVLAEWFEWRRATGKEFFSSYPDLPPPENGGFC